MLTEIAHGEVGQVGHCADNGSPFLHGIRKKLPKSLVVSNIFCTFVPENKALANASYGAVIPADNTHY